MDHGKIIRVTTTVTRPSTTIAWWPTGASMDEQIYNTLRLRYLWPGYMLTANDLHGTKGHSTRISPDELTMSWVRWWHSPEYYQRYLDDQEIADYEAVCRKYWATVGAQFNQTILEVDPKMTQNGHRYAGDNYFILKQFNTQEY